MRKHSVQQSIAITALAGQGQAQTLLTLPKGFQGYVRVKFVSGTATDAMFGMWVPVNSEQLPQGVGRLSTTDSGIHWLAGEEKTWILPPEGMALMAFGNGTLNGAFSTVDVNGNVEEQPQ